MFLIGFSWFKYDVERICWLEHILVEGFEEFL